MPGSTGPDVSHHNHPPAQRLDHPPVEADESVWRALFHDVNAAVTICDADGRIVYANEVSNRFYEWQRFADARRAAKPQRENVRDAAAANSIEERLAYFARVCKTGESLAYESVVQGVRNYVTVRPLRSGAGRLALITSRPMHAWERVEQLADETLTVVEPESHDSGLLASLSPRELQVLVLLAEGLTQAEIGEHLGLSTRTVERHRDSVGQKLGMSNRVHLARFAIRAGLAGLPDAAQALHLSQHPYDPLRFSSPIDKLARQRVRIRPSEE